MAVGPDKLKAFKAGGSPPLPQPPAPPSAPAAPPKPGAAAPGGGADATAVQKAAAEVTGGQTDPQVEQMMSAYDSTSGSPPEQAADAELWGHAVELVDPDGAGADKWPGADPWMIAGQLYLNLGGEIDQGEAGEPGGEGNEEPDADDMP